MTRRPVDINHSASVLHDVGCGPDASGDGFVACIFPVNGENTNCRLAVAEAACHILKGDKDDSQLT